MLLPRSGSSARLERHAFLNRRVNAYFMHADAEYFLAWRDGGSSGRISAQVDHAYNEFHGRRTGMFGFLEFEDDPEVLPRAARRRRGLAAPRGLRPR